MDDGLFAVATACQGRLMFLEFVVPSSCPFEGFLKSCGLIFKKKIWGIFTAKL